MNAEVLYLALMVGAANWLFRYGPTRMRPRAGAEGRLSRFLAATGPAAIATLVVASVLPMLGGGGAVLPLLSGVGAVAAIWVWRRSVVLATLAGSVAYGLGFALFG
ncbi:MAG: hypothetical protein RIT14_236 [Pseudomonadota bacterium]